MAQDTSEIAIEFVPASTPPIYCDGVWGGPTSRNYLSICFYLDRWPLPKTVIHQVTPNNLIGPEVERDVQKGLRREVVTEVIIDLLTAKDMIVWLQQQVESMEKSALARST